MVKEIKIVGISAGEGGMLEKERTSGLALDPCQLNNWGQIKVSGGLGPSGDHNSLDLPGTVLDMPVVLASFWI